MKLKAYVMLILIAISSHGYSSVFELSNKLEDKLKKFEIENSQTSFIIMNSENGVIEQIYNPKMAITQKFPPGSLMKVLTALSLEENERDQVFCDGKFYLKDVLIQFSDQKLFNIRKDQSESFLKCSLVEGHGKMELKDAITHSCNVFFLSIAKKKSEDFFNKIIENFSLNEKSNYISSKEVNEIEFASSNPELRTELERLNFVIGEGGSLLLSPLKVAQVFSAIWNGGKFLRPSFLVDKKNELAYSNKPFSKRYLETVQSAMRGVLKQGTLKDLIVENERVQLIGGKTGTATHEGKIYNTHAWNVILFTHNYIKYIFVGFVKDGRSMREGVALSKMVLNAF